MELYIYFTDRHSCPEIVSEMRVAVEMLKDRSVFVELIEFNGSFQIIGQLYGEDSNMGDTFLLADLGVFGYHWVDANTPKIHNLND